MADISKDDLRKEIAAILKGADLAATSAKKVRQELEEKLKVKLLPRKKEIDDLVMEFVSSKKDRGTKKKGKKDESDDEGGEDEEEEEEEEDEEEEEEDEEEEEEEDSDSDKKKKRSSTGKKPAAKKTKKGSDDSASDASEGESEEEYSPKKAAKPAKTRKLPPKKKKGSDSDSDEDWGKKKGGKKGGGGGGGRKGGSGYTKQLQLSPELAAVVGADTMARHEVVKKIWSIIKEKNMYDPKNKQYAICDDAMLKVIGTKRFRTFGMMKYLKHHFIS